jgi:hypothetical protein
MSQYSSSLSPGQSPAWPLGGRGLPVPASEQLSIWTVTNALWVPLLAIAMRLVSSPTANASYAIIAAYALVGPRQAIVALYLCWLFNMINHGIAPIAGYAAILRHVVILCAFVSVVIHSRRATYAKFGWLVPLTGVLCGFLIVHSMLFSNQTDVSLLKAISFSLTVSALALGWTSLGDRDRQLVESFLFGSLGVIAVASIPFVASPIGYYRNGQGFQGVLVHPQNFGPSMAVLAALLAAQSLTERRVRPWKGVVFGVAVVWIILSKARIGALALLAGLAFGIVGELIRSWFARHSSRKPMRKRRLVIASAMVLLGVLAAAPWLSSLLSEFIQKGSRRETLSEVAMASRGAKIEDMMRNIEEHPVFGIGFGTLLGDDYFLIQRDPVFGLPVMATVEKGVLPVAIVEETGFIGALVTYPWLGLLLVRSVRGGVVPGSVFWAVLATNIAEACLFSPGGQGMFQLIFAIWAATSPPVAAKQFVHRHPAFRRAA